MNVTGNKYFLRLLRVWRDEACASPVEGAILACGLAAAAMLAGATLRTELGQIFELVSSLAASWLS